MVVSSFCILLEVNDYFIFTWHTQMREFHARPFPEIIYSTAPARSAYAHAGAAGDANSTKKKNSSTQLKVTYMYTVCASFALFTELPVVLLKSDGRLQCRIKCH